jgi:hypothetical protein
VRLQAAGAGFVRFCLSTSKSGSLAMFAAMRRALL